ncbi:MAG TPA: dTDP-4-dehydrorhamnose 3,5-epimerase family protein [Candidatus Limnocylindrales bacterium]|nr:dTDP-4-dehydrorhamnose 3,5-epimerase family protein [Candidatus Limnocylindrales bacterium]
MTTDPSPGRPSSLPGVRYGQLTSHGDARGAFTELWRASAFGDPSDTSGPGGAAAPFVQANLSTSSAGVLRGLHLHRRQLDYWVVVAGRAFVALVDARPQIDGSAPSGPPVVETRELGPHDWVVIPAGVAHGFLALDALQLLYLVTNEYDGSDELGFAWDDPAVGVPWPAVPSAPDGQPIVSGRDASNPSLAELVARLRA